MKLTKDVFLEVAREFLGSRQLEVRLFHHADRPELFLELTVVDDVEDPYKEISVHDLARRGISAEVGEEILFKLYWLPMDEKHMRAQRYYWYSALAIPVEWDKFFRAFATKLRTRMTNCSGDQS